MLHVPVTFTSYERGLRCNRILLQSEYAPFGDTPETLQLEAYSQSQNSLSTSAFTIPANGLDVKVRRIDGERSERCMLLSLQARGKLRYAPITFRCRGDGYVRQSAQGPECSTSRPEPQTTKRCRLFKADFKKMTVPEVVETSSAQIGFTGRITAVAYIRVWKKKNLNMEPRQEKYLISRPPSSY